MASQAASLLDIVEVVYREEDLRGLRQLCTDLQEWMRYMSTDERRVVDRVIAADAGDAVERLDAMRRTEALARVRKRGRILNGREYELARDRVEQIFDDHALAGELAEWNELLRSYGR